MSDKSPKYDSHPEAIQALKENPDMSLAEFIDLNMSLRARDKQKEKGPKKSS